jgi:hypothetical protein
MHRSNAEKTSLRLPDDVRRWLAAKAEQHISSMTTEAIRAIRAQIRADMIRQEARRERVSSGMGRQH